MNLDNIEKKINEAFSNKDKISTSDKALVELIKETIELLDEGKIRVAEKKDGAWQVNQWIKKAILLSFKVNKMKASKGPYSTWYDKIEGKTQGWDEKKIMQAGFRYVPNGVIRKGAFIGKNVVLMPSFVNVGAFVDDFGVAYFAELPKLTSFLSGISVGFFGGGGARLELTSG